MSIDWKAESEWVNVDVNDYQLILDEESPHISYLEGHEDFVAYDGTIYPYEPHLIVNSGKYQVHEDDASDEVEMYIRVDMYGSHTIVGLYIPLWSTNWITMYYMAMNGDRIAIDYIMRSGMIEQGFRTMTAYGYDFEGWDLLIDWDFNWVFKQYGASVVGRSIYEEEPLHVLG